MSKRWSEEIKAQAAADLLAGMTVREVAAKYGMPHTTAANLTHTSKRGAVYVRKIANINDLHERFLEQLDHNLNALKALTDHIQKQTRHAVEHGDKLGIVYGVVFDKTGKLAGAAVAGAGIHSAALSGDGAASDPDTLGTTDADDTQSTPEAD